MPDPQMICVVVSAGYVVSVRLRRGGNVSTDPVLDVVAAPSAGLVLFASHTDILAHIAMVSAGVRKARGTASDLDGRRPHLLGV
jgi:hypothetical protein